MNNNEKVITVFCRQQSFRETRTIKFTFEDSPQVIRKEGFVIVTYGDEADPNEHWFANGIVLRVKIRRIVDGRPDIDEPGGEPE